MSDNICPNCKSKINKGDKFCKNCGFALPNQKTNTDEIKSNFINFTEDIASKIQNKLENEDVLKTNDIKEMIKNLDEDSFNKLLDKYGISPSKLKLLDFNKLFDKVDINRLKDDLIEFGIINPKPDSDVETVRAEVIIDDDNEDSQENEIPVVDGGKVPKEPIDEEEKPQNEETSKPPEEEKPSNIAVCSKCGFENRSKVKFCTNCGNKLI